MKRSRIGQFALGALVVAMCCGVHAQGSEPAAASEQAASAMSAKDAKAANRKLQKDVIRVLAAITVRANNGDVVLEGAVPEQSQMAIATKAAEGVPGVKSVKNMLTLSQF